MKQVALQIKMLETILGQAFFSSTSFEVVFPEEGRRCYSVMSFKGAPSAVCALPPTHSSIAHSIFLSAESI